MADFVSWCRRLRGKTRRWVEGLLAHSSTSSEISVVAVGDDTRADAGERRRERYRGSTDGVNVANDLHPQDLMNHGKQGSKRSINCLDTGTSGSERERAHNKEATPDTSVYKSDQSTGEHIVADTEEGVVEKVVGKAEEEQQLTEPTAGP